MPPYPQRLPIVDGDDGVWGDIIRQYLEKEHYNDDTNNPDNGGHKNVTIRPGSTSPGTAPLKLNSGPLLSSPEAGAIEFNTDTLYVTQNTNTTRKKIAIYDDSSGGTGDIYYRNSAGYFTRLPIGNSTDVLRVSSGMPMWQTAPTAVKFTPTGVWGDGINVGSIQVGSISYVRVPYSGTITSWHIVANASCTCILDVWKAAGALPTNANSITASAKPALSASATTTSSTLTGWTTSVASGNVFGFEIESLTGTPTSITLVLEIT